MGTEAHQQKILGGDYRVVAAIMVVFNVDTLTIEQTVVMLSAGATLIAYIVGEGLVDAARIKK